MRYSAVRLIGRRFGGGFLAPRLPLLGIALGVGLLVCALSVMNGFERAFREHVLSLSPHLLLYPVHAEQLGELEDFLHKHAKDMPQIVNVSPFVHLHGVLRFAGQNRPISLYGIAPQDGTAFDMLGSYLPSQERLEDWGEDEILIGSLLAQKLGVHKGDSLLGLFPLHEEGKPLRLQQVRFDLRAIFDSGTELDKGLGFLSRESALQWARRINLPVALRLELAKPETAPQLAYFLRRSAPVPLSVQDWTTSQGDLFAAVQLSRQLISVLLFALVLVAAFNVIATLLLMIDKRQGEIALLGVLGASQRTILSGILLRGLTLGVSGTILGLGAGILLSLCLEDILFTVQRLAGFQLLSRESYFIDYLPVSIVVEDLLLISVLSLFLCLLAALYPAWRAAKIRPAEALRWE